ncbi:MAG TPA: phosphoenolpyruvate--protein phosphotransferase [Candidatus Limnocylindrales bacterium]|nr:phosphoenolpyruvate--protein phosphotransferase [Candidatus Limnocylindrales bacterium]
MKQLRGTGASPGVALGPVVRVDRWLPPEGRRIGPAEITVESDRVAAAAEAAARDLEGLASDLVTKGLPAEAAIFEAQAAMARDHTLLEAARARIAGGVDAATAVRGAADDAAAQLAALDDPLIAARAADVVDVGRRIAEVLDPSAVAPQVSLEAPSIVVAADLAPSITATLPRDRLLGIALEQGSPTSHAAILARGYGIPAVVAAAGLLDAVGSAHARTIALDGTSGEVTIEPDDETRAVLERTVALARTREADEASDAAEPAVTRDGVEIRLLANIGAPGEAAHARALGAQGVGLFRTEFLFLERRTPPGEDEQATAYREVVEAFAPDPVVIRLLDVGGDKPIPFLRLPAEANPFLGVRALRIAGARPALFETQLRAAMRAAAGLPPGVVKVMAPMVADGVDADLLIRLAADARRSLATSGVAHGEVALGVMLEIPSAILTADAYFGRVAFASLGTNDLAQYTLAADRGNPQLGRYQDALHPAVLRLVGDAVSAAERAGIELSVCGELAGDAAGALALVGLGIRRLSMAASSLPAVRRVLRAATVSELERRSADALRLPDAAAVRAMFADPPAD